MSCQEHGNSMGSATLPKRLASQRQGKRGEKTHDTSLSVEVRVDLLLKRGLVGVTSSDGDSERSGLLLGLSSDVLPDGNGGVDASALLEERSDGSAGSLGGDEDDVDVLGGDDVGLSGEKEEGRKEKSRRSALKHRREGKESNSKRGRGERLTSSL
jgi:hypothetical protein